MIELDCSSSDALRVRQCIAAFALRFTRRILEVGGGDWPVSMHLTMPTQSVTVVDPRAKPFRAVRWNGHVCRVRHLAMRIEDYVDEETSDGLALLGFPGWEAMDRACIMGFVQAADTVVVEAARNRAKAFAAVEDLVAASGKRAESHLTLECRGGGLPENYRYRQRELFILRS